MQTHQYNTARSVIAILLSTIVFADLSAVTLADTPTTQERAKPKVVIDAGTEADADAAISVVGKFLVRWDQRKYEEASALVAEPVRQQFIQDMKKRDIKLQSIDDIRLFSPNEVLIARVHASVAPDPDRKDLKRQEIGIDMVFRDGKWWVTSR